MDTADFKVYAGVDNHIEFLLRKTDRKAISVVGKKVFIYFKDRRSGEIIHQQELLTLNPDTALMLLLLPKSVTDTWEIGALSYGAIIEEPSEYDPNVMKQLLLFTDEREGSQGYCYVEKSPILMSPPAEEDEAWEPVDMPPNMPPNSGNSDNSYKNNLGVDPDADGDSGPINLNDPEI